MNLNLKSSGHINWKDLHKSCFNFFSCHIKSLVFLIIFALFGICVYIWYENVYNSGWSEAEKQSYIQNKEKGVSLNKKNFDRMVEEYAWRYQESQNLKESRVDIFRLNQ